MIETANLSTRKYIVNLKDRQLPKTIGNKAANLRRLQEKKFRIPDTLVCTWQAYLDWRQTPQETLGRLRTEIYQAIKPTGLYAIRSSANLEDDLEHSFAGQFRTYLDVQGVEPILQAIEDIWKNTCTESVLTYLEKMYHNPPELKMAVLIQEMISPQVSGVAFSKNPITTLDEILVEAVQGSGVSLVQEGVTPLRWVNKWGNWIHQPDESQIPLRVTEEVVKGVQQIVKLFKMEVDLEWVYSGTEIFWLQLRRITSIQQSSIYSNKIAKEMSPGLIKPLVWSVSIPIPAQAWVRLISEITGDTSIQADSLVKAFHYRAYYNMGIFGDILESLGLPRESLEMMMGVLPPGAGKPPMKMSTRSLRLLPRLFRFLVQKWNFARTFKTYFPQLEQEAQAFPLDPAAELDEYQLQATIDEIIVLNRKITYFTVVSMLLMQAYHGMLRSRLKRLGIPFDQFDLTHNLAELNGYDSGESLAQLHESYLVLDEKTRRLVESGDYTTLIKYNSGCAFHTQLKEFFTRFGHLSDTTSNFSSVPWRETPGMILRLIADYQKPQENQRRITYADLPKKNWALKLFYQRSRKFRLYREMSSSLYTYTLMLARAYYLRIADKLVARGVLAEREGIFYLYEPEIRSYLAGDLSVEQILKLTEQRKTDMEHCREAILPEVIFSEEVPLVVAKPTDKLYGTPTSRGYYTGPVRIVQGIQDFHKLTQGDVLVIPYSDAGWTPLFAMAGAVLAESGGILSHSSIIAREYGIPAVVSVSGALQLEDGCIVTVDGFKGEIHLYQETLPAIQPVSRENFAELD